MNEKWKIGFCSTRLWVGDEVCVSHDLLVAFLHWSCSPTDLRFHLLSTHTWYRSNWQINGFLDFLKKWFKIVKILCNFLLIFVTFWHHFPVSFTRFNDFLSSYILTHLIRYQQYYEISINMRVESNDRWMIYLSSFNSFFLYFSRVCKSHSVNACVGRFTICDRQ